MLCCVGQMMDGKELKEDSSYTSRRRSVIAEDRRITSAYRFNGNVCVNTADHHLCLICKSMKMLKYAVDIQSQATMIVMIVRLG